MPTECDIPDLDASIDDSWWWWGGFDERQIDKLAYDDDRHIGDGSSQQNGKNETDTSVKVISIGDWRWCC